jgi:16S rRNA (guanine527-N7)-methyltransferase
MHADIEELARELGHPLDPQARDLCVRFADLVQTWNARMNLTAAREPRALVEVLFADALVAAGDKLISEDGRLVDVGSGAGAPAIPLLLLRPDLDGTLVEPLRKRVAFIRTALGSLRVADRVRVIEARIEPESPELSGRPYDVAISRATWAKETWLDVGLALAPRVLVFTAAGEPPKAPEGVVLAETCAYHLPFSGAPRCIAAYDAG